MKEEREGEIQRGICWKQANKELIVLRKIKLTLMQCKLNKKRKGNSIILASQSDICLITMHETSEG